MHKTIEMSIIVGIIVAVAALIYVMYPYKKESFYETAPLANAPYSMSIPGGQYNYYSEQNAYNTQ